MEQLNVVVTQKLEEKHLKQIAAVSPAIKVTDTSAYFFAELRGDFNSKDKFSDLLARAEVICGFWPPANVMSRAPKLQWFHTLLAGLDNPGYVDILRSNITITNSTGVHKTQIGELVLMLMLMLAKKAPLSLKLQQEKKWGPFVPMLLHGKTLGIVGLGSIGKEVARLGKSFGMRVVANRRSVKQVTRARNVDVLMPGDHLPELLSQSDFVVLTLAVTTKTEKIIGEKELRSMKPAAFLINIARGKVIDEDMLIRALEENWIAGAGLDTVTAEPLPPESKLWGLTNVIITPHIAGRREDYYDLAVDLFCDNLSRYINGKKLRNAIDRQKGY